MVSLALVSRSLIAAIVLELSTVAALHAQEPPAEPTRVSPGASTRVWIMAAWDDNCRPLPAPKIEITAKPGKGTVSLQEGQSTTIRSSRSGTCSGVKVPGTGIYYTANPDADGPDSFSIEARLPSGEATNRSFNMSIAN